MSSTIGICYTRHSIASAVFHLSFVSGILWSSTVSGCVANIMPEELKTRDVLSWKCCTGVCADGNWCLFPTTSADVCACAVCFCMLPLMTMLAMIKTIELEFLRMAGIGVQHCSHIFDQNRISV